MLQVEVILAFSARIGGDTDELALYFLISALLSGGWSCRVRGPTLRDPK